MDIKHLELTEQDFALLLEGLESLPEKGTAGEMMGMLLEGMITDKSPEAQAKMKYERERRSKELQKKRDDQKEDIRILQGKLIMLKRWLQTQGALKAVDDIVNPL